MNALLDRFFESLKNDCRTVEGTCVRLGAQMTPDSIDDMKVLQNNFTALWIISGKASFSENGHTYSISDMSCCLCRPDREWVLNLENGKSDYIYLTLPPEFYPAVTAMIPGLSNFMPVKRIEYRNELLYACLELHQKLKGLSADELYTIWPILIKYILELTGISASPVGSQMKQARRMLEDTASQKTLKQIAEECNINYNTFRKQFTDTFGVTPGQYRITYRIEAAKNALLLGIPIDETSEKFGFSDVYSFTRRFKAVTGISPGKYRSSTKGYPLTLIWKRGYVGSSTHPTNPEILVRHGLYYSYSQMVRFPKAGTVISLTEDKTHSNGDMKHASPSVYVFSNWKNENGEWIIDTDRYNANGTKAEHHDIGGERTYTYVTQRANEYMRFCFRSGQTHTFTPETYPDIMVSKGSPAEIIE